MNLYNVLQTALPSSKTLIRRRAIPTIGAVPEYEVIVFMFV